RSPSQQIACSAEHVGGAGGGQQLVLIGFQAGGAGGGHLQQVVDGGVGDHGGAQFDGGLHQQVQQAGFGARGRGSGDGQDVVLVQQAQHHSGQLVPVAYAHLGTGLVEDGGIDGVHHVDGAAGLPGHQCPFLGDVRFGEEILEVFAHLAGQ